MKKKQKLSFDYFLSEVKKSKLQVSILIDNPLPKHFGQGKESYVGRIINIDNKFIYLETIYSSKLGIVALKKSFILSVWIYNNKLAQPDQLKPSGKKGQTEAMDAPITIPPNLHKVNSPVSGA